jgi:protein-S-isoprenylcysteine O-methyltransferase Ste14
MPPRSKPRGIVSQLEIPRLDLGFRPVNSGFMGPLHRAINLIVALTLVALGCAGVVYFYFIATIWNQGLAVAAGIVAVAGLYWLWDEYVHKWPESEH